MPGGLSREFLFCRDVLLIDHPDRTTILTKVRNGVSVYEFLLPDARGVSVEHPFNPVVFPGEKLPNRVPEEFREFIAGEVATLVRRGCLIQFEDVRTSNGASRPRLIVPLSLESSNPRLIYDARRLNAAYRHVCFSLDSVGFLVALDWEGCYQGSLDDKPAFYMSFYTQHRGPCLGWFGRISRAYGRFFHLVGTRAHMYVALCMYVWSSHIAEYGSTG